MTVEATAEWEADGTRCFYVPFGGAELIGTHAVKTVVTVQSGVSLSNEMLRRLQQGPPLTEDEAHQLAKDLWAAAGALSDPDDTIGS